MVRNVLIAILKISELFQDTFTSICILSDPSGRSVSVIAVSNLPGGMDVCFECSVLPGRGSLCRADHSETLAPWGLLRHRKKEVFFALKIKNCNNAHTTSPCLSVRM